jgi:hypothetical protein
MVIRKDQSWEFAMTLNRSTPLKLGAIAFAVLWAAWMIWSSGPFDRANIIMFSISGAVIGFLWYFGMRWFFERMQMPPDDQASP